MYQVLKDKEFENGLTDFYDILLKWKEEQPENNRDTYHKLFEKVYSFNKHIVHYYDRI